MTAAAEREALRETAREFVRREIAPHLQDWEDAGTIPRELHLAAARQGLLGVSFPEEVGGEGGDLADTVALQEAFFEAGASSGLMAGLFTGGIALPHIAASGDTDLIDRFVRPTLAGETDRLARDHRARRRLGRRRHHHPRRARRRPLRRQRRQDLHHLRRARRLRHHRRPHRRPGPRRGQPARRREGHARLHRRPLPEARWAGTAPTPPSCRTSTCGCPSPTSSAQQDSGFYQIAEQFVVERIALAVHAYGIAARSLELTAAYCRERETFGKPLIANQVVRHKLVEMHRQVEVARAYTHAVVARHVAGETVIAEAALAKQTAVDASTYVCDQAVQLHGGTGYMHGTEVERHYRDARILPIGGGATEVLTDLAAKLLGYAR